jgi:hypothetical protein
MRVARWPGATALAVIAALGGCNAMFGFEQAEAYPDAEAAGSDAATEQGGSSGSGGAAVDASVEGSAGGTDGGAGDASHESDGADGATSCDGGAQPIGTVGQPCCTANELACGGHAQTLMLLCDGASWQANGECAGNQLCDTTPGSTQGSCLAPVAQCVGHNPGDKVCDGLKSIECGPDLVTSTEATCQYACVEGNCSGTCNSGDKQCKGHVPQGCDANGAWQDGAPCEFVCSGGDCVGVCAPQSKQCNGLVPQVCDVTGQWQDGTACASVCLAGECSGNCTPGTKQCNGVVPQSCASNGAWQDGAPCEFVCSGGDCAGVCAPGSTRCSAFIPQTCDAAGQWQGGPACQYVCSEGVCGICVPGSTQCSGLVPQTCDSTGHWQSGNPCQYSCTDGSCGACNPGSYRCDADIPEVCNTAGKWISSTHCGNPACAQYVCVDSAPATWNGPISMYAGVPSATPACGGAFSSNSFLLNTDPVQTAATCSTCTCSASNVKCNVSVFASQQTNCSSTTQKFVTDIACTDWGTTQLSMNIIQINGTAGSTTCTQGPGQTPTVPPATWGTAARGCALPFPAADGCASGAVCAPVPNAPFNGKLCIYKIGDNQCPAGGYTQKHVFYDSFTDTRTCTSCSCQINNPICSNHTVHAYSDASCGSEVAAVTSNGCKAMTWRSARLTASITSGGTCTPAGGQPTGAITPTGPATVCCTP